MDKINRRDFLKLVGVGSGAALASTLPVPGVMNLFQTENQISFRGVAGVPSSLFPVYASYVVQGSVDLVHKTGVMTRSLFAGAPSENSTLALPGTSRAIRVTGVIRQGSVTRVLGVIDDRSQLLPGEDHMIDLKIDQDNGVAEAELFGSLVRMRLTS